MTKTNSKKNISSDKITDTFNGALNFNSIINPLDPNQNILDSQNRNNVNYNPQTTNYAAAPVLNQNTRVINALIQYRDTLAYYTQQYYATQAYLAYQARNSINSYIPVQSFYPYIVNKNAKNNFDPTSYPSFKVNTSFYNQNTFHTNRNNVSSKDGESVYLQRDNDTSAGLVFHASDSFSKFLKKKKIMEWKKEKKAKKEKEKAEKKVKKDITEKKDITYIPTPIEKEIIREKSPKSNQNTDQSVIVSSSLLNIDEKNEKKIEKKLASSNWDGVLKKCKEYNPINRCDYWQQFFVQNKIFALMEKADFYVKSAIIGFLLGQKFHAAFLLKETLKDKYYDKTLKLIAILKNLIKKVPFETYQSIYSIGLNSDIPKEPEGVLAITKILSSVRKTRSSVSEKILKDLVTKIFKLILSNDEDELLEILSTLNKNILRNVANEYYLTYGRTICEHVEENSNFATYIKEYVTQTIPLFIDENNYIVQFFINCSIKEGDSFFFWHMLIHILEDGKFDVISSYEEIFGESIMTKIKLRVPSYLWKIMLKYIQSYIPEYSVN